MHFTFVCKQKKKKNFDHYQLYFLFIIQFFFFFLIIFSFIICDFFFLLCLFFNNRHEVKALSNSNTKPSNNKERLTIDWISQAITEIRGELAELQEASSNTSRHLQQRNQYIENIAELREDFDKLKLELGALHMRQETIDYAVKELQSEAIQRDEDYRHSQLQVRLYKYNRKKIKKKYLTAFT